MPIRFSASYEGVMAVLGFQPEESVRWSPRNHVSAARPRILIHYASSSLEAHVLLCGGPPRVKDGTTLRPVRTS